VEYRNRVFGAGERVLLDGSTFIDCTFDGCIMELRGQQSYKIRGCKFGKLHYEFLAGAGLGFTFLRTLYQLPDGKSRIDNLFNSPIVIIADED
jgi:hypothetical protein